MSVVLAASFRGSGQAGRRQGVRNLGVSHRVPDTFLPVPPHPAPHHETSSRESRPPVQRVHSRHRKAGFAFGTGRDLVDRLKQDPASLNFGITGLGSPNHLGVAAPLKEAGMDIRRIRAAVFPSGGAASTAKLEGHVDVVPISTSFAASLACQGQVRLLAVSAPTRLPGVLADVPKWREQAYDAVVSNWRALWGPKGITGAQIAYWEEAVWRMVESVEKELEANAWMSEYLRSDARKYLDRDYVQARAVLVELGLAK